MRLMFSFPFLEVYVRFAAVNAMLWLAADVEAQTASKTGPIKPDPGLVADYWVHLSIVAILLLFFAGLSVFALTKFYKAMSDQTNGGLWLETHWGGSRWWRPGRMAGIQRVTVLLDCRRSSERSRCGYS